MAVHERASRKNSAPAQSVVGAGGDAMLDTLQRSMVLTVAFGGVLFIVVLMLTQLALMTG
jgi:hypothetical protein